MDARVPGSLNESMDVQTVLRSILPKVAEDIESDDPSMEVGESYIILYADEDDLSEREIRESKDAIDEVIGELEPERRQYFAAVVQKPATSQVVNPETGERHLEKREDADIGLGFQRIN